MIQKRLEDNTMTNETKRLFFTLKVITYSQYKYGDCRLDDPRTKSFPQKP